MKSTRWKLHLGDWLKGLLVTIGTTALTTLGQSLAGGKINAASLKLAGIAGGAAGITYITKNFMTNDVKAATKTIEKAGGSVNDNIKLPIQ